MNVELCRVHRGSRYYGDGGVEEVVRRGDAICECCEGKGMSVSGDSVRVNKGMYLSKE